MKKILTFLCAAIFALSCSSEGTVKVTFENTTDVDRQEEMVELDLAVVKRELGLVSGSSIVVSDSKGEEIPSQITYDGKLIFQVDVAPSASSTYVISIGTPAEAKSKVFGRQFPERVDDFAWENDRIAFRMYGPALQATGERAYGYDVWVKSTPELVVEDRYKTELDPAMNKRIAELRKTDEKAATELQNTISYHVDHGNGMDCYKVGPTLGAGAAALMDQGIIAYPYCYSTYDVLDNGPLRLTVKFVYTPLTIDGKSNVVETRVLTVDAGTHFNKTCVSYTNLLRPTPIVAGIVMAGGKGTEAKVSKELKYAAYADVDRPEEQGAIYVGTIFTEKVGSAGIIPFTNADDLQKQLGMTGHVSLVGDYTPDSKFVYYWGAAWEQYDVNSFEEWVSVVEGKSKMISTPLVVTMK